MHNNMKMARYKYTRWHGYISLDLGNVPVTYCLSAPNLLSPMLCFLKLGQGPAHPISALPSFSMSASATRGTADFKTGGGRRNLLHPSTFRDPPGCFWLLCASPCNASLPWQQQILFLAAFEYSLQFCPTLGKAALSDSASPDTSQPLFLRQMSGSHSGPSSELRH